MMPYLWQGQHLATRSCSREVGRIGQWRLTSVNLYRLCREVGTLGQWRLTPVKLCHTLCTVRLIEDSNGSRGGDSGSCTDRVLKASFQNRMPIGEPNLFGLQQFDYRTSFFASDPLFSQGVGYAVLVGLGTCLALFTILVFYLDQKSKGSDCHSEEFNTAGRNIKTGLIAVDVVSHWTWVATLLQSTLTVYEYGISGGIWFVNGAVIQVFIFAAFAIQLKRKAPKAHTFVELVRHRWGHTAGFVFFYLCYLNNTIVATMVIIGAANIFVAGTGLNVYAALILVPLSIVVYTVVGGLKATFISSYLHTVVIFVGLNILVYAVYASGTYPIRNISEMWHNLNAYARVAPVRGNKDGSFMTIYSSPGIQFGVLNTVAAFGNIFADQACWQTAIAASPRASFRGYLLGGLVWFPIPLTLGIALGLGAIAMDLPISSEESEAGLVALATTQFLLGKGGVLLVLIMIFMAATSTGSAELIGMSSLFTYDAYKAYIRPKATGSELLLVSRISVCVLGILMGGLSCILYKVGVNVNFLFLVMGVLVSSAVPPLALLLTWPAVSKGAAIAGALGGQTCGIAAWLVHTKVVYSRISITNLQQLAPTTDGTVVSILVSAIICITWTLVFPDKEGDFSRFEEIELMDGVNIVDYHKEDPAAMTQYLKQSVIASVVLSVLFLVVWPLLTLPAGVFSEGYFIFFVVLTVIWAAVATVICILYPLLESRHGLLRAGQQLLGFSIKSNHPSTRHPNGSTELIAGNRRLNS